MKIFGRKIRPVQLLHADKHGFLIIPKKDEKELIKAAQFMDQNECETVITAARNTSGLPTEELLNQRDDGAEKFEIHVRKVPLNTSFKKFANTWSKPKTAKFL